MESKKVSTFAPAKQETDAPVAQLVEHLTLNQGVQGSSPCGCTREKKRVCDAPVAQLVEHLTLNQGVQSSSLCGCTKHEISSRPKLSAAYLFKIRHKM